MERTNSVMILLVLFGLLAGTFAGTANDAFGADKRLRKLAGWDNLRAVAHGRKVRVRSHDGELFQGRFKAVNSEALMIHSRTGEKTVSRQAIAAVWVKGQPHRMRDTLALAGIFGAAGFALAKIHQSRQKECPPGLPLGYPFCGKDSNGVIATVVLFEAGTGALLGALLTNTGWTEVYRAAAFKVGGGKTARSKILAHKPIRGFDRTITGFHQ